MPSILPGYTYDIFISYRQKDNKGEHWVTEFVRALKEELDSTFKEDISIYFDENPSDGLLETHHVDKSLESKLKSLIFIPILSQTYCDPKSFAWQQEFCVFNKLAKNDTIGREVRLSNGNVGSRILPVKIHELEQEDRKLVERELGDVLRAIEFTFKSPGVNRPLRFSEDNPQSNLNKFFYRDQINKVANAIKAIVEGAKAEPIAAKIDQLHTTEPAGKFVEQIKEKDLARVALVYVIAALVFWKAADIVSNLLSFPTNLSNGIAIFLAALFPFAMFLAWKFEKSPTGFVRTGSPAARNNPLSRKEKKPLTGSRAILSLVAVMLVLYFIPQNFLPGLVAVSAPASENKSIAVLYFDNMSGDESQDYLSEGLTEEIITRLTKIPGLRVISRTSVRVYKGQPLNLKKIASDLNVAIVLEGSVRKAGNQLRVTAQLINAETDEHLWAESYDREMTDVFEVQKEIAQVIADKFKIETSPEVNIRVNEISTRNTEAYEYYLKGKHIAFTQYYFIGDTAAFIRAKMMYERAIALDPEFALALAGLADLYDAARSSTSAFPKDLDSLRHALSWKAYQLDPNSDFVNNVRIWMLNNRDTPLKDSAFFHARKALQLQPNDYYNHESFAFMLRSVGQEQLSIAFLKKALDLNPLAPEVHANLADSYLTIGETELGDKEMQIAYDLAPNQNLVAWEVMMWLISKGRLEEAEQMRNQLIARYPKTQYSDILCRLLIARGDREGAMKMISTFGFKARLYALLGMKDEMLAELSKLKEGKRDFYLNLKYLSPWTDFHDDPRFQKILAAQEIRHKEYEKHFGKYAEGLNP